MSETHYLHRQYVRNKILSCNACSLGSSNRVPYDGPTSSADLLLIGEAPGATEDKTGKPFQGRAGKLLNELLERVGTRRNKTTVANTVCCRPPGNRDPEWFEIEACKPNFLLQTSLTRARVGVTLGRVATSIVLEDPKVSIGATRSTPFMKWDKVWIPTYHPAYALRNPQAKAWIEDDLRLAMSFVGFAAAILEVDKRIGAQVVL